MRKVVDAQISDPFDGEGATAKLGRRVWIGGEVIELEVTREGVESRVLRAVGEPVGEVAQVDVPLHSLAYD